MVGVFVLVIVVILVIAMFFSGPKYRNGRHRKRK